MNITIPDNFDFGFSFATEEELAQPKVQTVQTELDDIAQTKDQLELKIKKLTGEHRTFRWIVPVHHFVKVLQFTFQFVFIESRPVDVGRNELHDFFWVGIIRF